MSQTPEPAKLVMLAGLLLFLLGGGWWLLGRLGFRGIPGDIRVETEHVRLYFPLGSCLTLSAVISLALWFLRVAQKR